MANLAKWIEAMAEGEEIEGIIIGHFHDIDGPTPKPHANTLISWNAARSLIDYEFDESLGIESCHPVYAWTRSWVIAIAEYDGAHRPVRIPRNPISCEAEYASDGIEDDEMKRLGIYKYL